MPLVLSSFPSPISLKHILGAALRLYKNGFFYMMIRGSGTESLMDLWGRTLAPFRYSSSFTITSSPSTVTFSMRTWRNRVVKKKNSQESHNLWGTCLWGLLTHWPTEELQPTMQLSSQECDRTRAPFSTVQRFILTPSSTTTPAPMVTFGPMVQFSPICAVGSYRGGRGWTGC